MATASPNDPYASHIPFLTRIGKGVHSVLELGCGLYSTSLFLDLTVYPDLVKLVSVEHDYTWARRMALDPRLTMIITPEPIEDYLATLNLGQFNLIFVDNSTDWETRAKTIRWLAQQDLGQARVVIHDYEYASYQEAAAGFTRRIVDSTTLPHTAMVWK